jgi:hypothetical protein
VVAASRICPPRAGDPRQFVAETASDDDQPDEGVEPVHRGLTATETYDVGLGRAIPWSAMSASQPSYRLFESAGFLAPYPAFADSDDFDALRLWAVDHNDWKGVRTAAMVASDDGRFWYVRRDGSTREISNVRGRTGGPSQAEKHTARLDGRMTAESAAQLGYDIPPPERWQHKTFHVPSMEHTDAVHAGRGNLDVEDTLDAIDEINRPRTVRPPQRYTAAENKVIEQYAVDLVRQYFEARRYTTTDVGATESYDVHAVGADDDVVKIEVKGTTTDGSEIVLTYNEVQLHMTEHPNTALAIVRHIVLDRTGPTASGGELQLQMPWELEPERLKPIAYRYRTGH